MIASYALPSFDSYFAAVTPRDQDRMLAFAQQYLDCASPKTRQLAKDFLKKWTTP